MTAPDERESDAISVIGWGRAALTTALVVIVGLAVLVYGPNMVLTRVHSIGRSARVAVATAIFACGLVGLAWLLRRLQRRGLI